MFKNKVIISGMIYELHRGGGTGQQTGEEEVGEDFGPNRVSLHYYTFYLISFCGPLLLQRFLN